MLFVLGFFSIFVLDGLSGVTLAVIPFDLQVHDTFYVVAHFHYVLIGGAVFPLLGGIYYWFPKMTGRMMSERLGRWNFWTLFVGFNVTFFPMHLLGFLGMPRRVYTYPASMGWGTLNLLATGGALLMALGGLLLVVNVVRSRRKGAVAGDNPWNADTLEWGTSSPPPVYNFLHVPIVEGPNALWDRSAEQPVVTVGAEDDIAHRGAADRRRGGRRRLGQRLGGSVPAPARIRRRPPMRRFRRRADPAEPRRA